MDMIETILDQFTHSSINLDEAAESIIDGLYQQDNQKIDMVVKEIACNVLNLKMTSVKIDRPLSDYGMDSIISMDLFRCLQDLFEGVEIGHFINSDTLSDIARQIEKHADPDTLKDVSLMRYKDRIKNCSSMLSTAGQRDNDVPFITSEAIEKQRKALFTKLSEFGDTGSPQNLIANGSEKIPSYESFDLKIDERHCIWVVFKTKTFGIADINNTIHFMSFLAKKVDLSKVPIIYFTHYGDHFILGGPRKYLVEAKSDEERKQRFLKFSERYKALTAIDLPEDFPLRIAVCSGTAQGGGFEFLTQCDFQFVLPQCKLGVPEIKSSMYAGMGGLSYMASQVGLPRTKLINITGGLIFGTQAYDMGVVSHLSLNPFQDAYLFLDAIPNIKVAKHINHRLNRQYKKLRLNDVDDWTGFAQTHIVSGYRRILDDYRMITKG